MLTNERLESRLEELTGELTAGEKRLRELDAEAVVLRETLLRISGAMQVLRELLDEGADADQASSPPRTRMAPVD